jgi:hypothetical protein
MTSGLAIILFVQLQNVQNERDEPKRGSVEGRNTLLRNS